MSGVSKVEVTESVETLKSLMKQQKTALNHAKVQSLYLLKINVAETVRYLAVIMGRSESTIYHWLQLYKTGGMSKLLEEPPQTGRPTKLEIETIASLQQELSDPEGFSSYKEIQLWLLICQNIEISYPTVHRIVRYELKGKLKVPRPIHEKQQPGIITAFKKHFPDRIKGIISDLREKWGNKPTISYWCQDETRLGYRTESGKKITREGVKPQQILQWHYSYYYIYGLVDPVGGRSFFYEFSHFDSNCLGVFLEQFAQEHNQEINIIQLDNALGLHRN
jgi:transposase